MQRDMQTKDYHSTNLKNLITKTRKQIFQNELYSTNWQKKQLKNSIPTLAVHEYEPSASQESQWSCIYCVIRISNFPLLYILIINSL